jgi:phosphate transport system permease protein
MKIDSQRNIAERVMKAVFAASAGAAIFSLVLICLFLFSNGLPAIFQIGSAEFLGTDWAPTDEPPSFGILPMILGSVYVTLGAMIIGAPIGIFTAVFMAFYCPKSIYKLLKPAIDLLAGIPSIVYGFFGMVLLVPFVREHFGGTGASILTASIILGVMILPTIISISEAALRAVPSACYENAMALGSTHERSIFYAVLPAAKSGVLAAVVLGVGRAIGETMAVIMVAGNQARMPNGILRGVRTMTANIVIEMGYAADLHREALFATALVLLLFILIINLVLHKVTK